MKATTTMLMKELDKAGTYFKLLKSSMKDRSGINSVHSFEFTPDSATLRYFPELDTGKKIFDREKFSAIPEEVPTMGHVLKRHQSKKGVIFIPFETNKNNATDDAPDPKTLAGRIWPALKKYATGVCFRGEDSAGKNRKTSDEEI
jgi:hypothetical protein